MYETMPWLEEQERQGCRHCRRCAVCHYCLEFGACMGDLDPAWLAYRELQSMLYHDQFLLKRRVTEPDFLALPPEMQGAYCAQKQAEFDFAVSVWSS